MSDIEKAKQVITGYVHPTKPSKTTGKYKTFSNNDNVY